MTDQATSPADASPDSIRRSVERHLRCTLARRVEDATPDELLEALALTTRDLAAEAMLATEVGYARTRAKRVYYLSIEFLLGRSLENNLINLGIRDQVREALSALGVDLDRLLEREPDAALGNGGLGRLAACFLDSMATLGMPGFGYGINYEFGLFRQVLLHGEQHERPDVWPAAHSPFLVERAAESCLVPTHGWVERGVDKGGEYNPMWLGWREVVGVPFDYPVIGYGGRSVNRLRLFAARASRDFDVQIFNTGDYLSAVTRKIESESISKVLYPADTVEPGRELRVLQEYFLVACAVRDISRQFESLGLDYSHLSEQVAIQLNDTHPALAVAELMRLLVDEKGLPWDTAWEQTRQTCAYTNHTLMAEALERWPVPLLEHVLPRHLEVIFEVNRRFLDEVQTVWPGDVERQRRLSLVEESEPKQVRMAHLAIVGGHSVNGVSELHSRLVREQLVPDFAALWPHLFNNKTNGVTPRRWLLQANPGLAELVTELVGPGWVTDLELLRGLEAHADSSEVLERMAQVKRHNKERLERIVHATCAVRLDPSSMFDVQVKRFHEYKRQLLHLLGAVYEYLRLVEDGEELDPPRTHLFGGKAAPGYWTAKQVIALVNAVGRTVSSDPRVRDQLRVVFMPDYRVSLAERIIPAADLSEQISTAGTEASGTGNMKFALNGALTMGTLDGANIEIRDAVGADNIFIFGLTTEEVRALKASGYNPWEVYHREECVRRVVDALRSGRFSSRPDQFLPVVQTLLEGGDPYCVLADLPAYLEAQEAAARLFLDRTEWHRRALLNVARVGRFSSDRTIAEYARDIWGVETVGAAAGGGGADATGSRRGRVKT